MSKVSVFGKACDAFPATMTGSDGLRLLLPGSSIKGALRARAEYIARTACGVRAADVGDSLLEQLALASKLPGVRALFGAAGNWPGGDSGCRGALEVPDVTTEVSIPEKEWRAVRYGPLPECPGGENAAFAKAVDRLNSRLNSETHGDGLWFDYVTRNAIDRWSGGVANGQLYSSLEPYAAKVGVWRDIVLDVDMDRLKCNCGQEGDTGNDDGAGVSQDVACQMNVALALLALTVRDLVDGWVPLGFGVTRGLGSVEIEPGNVSLDAQDSPLQGMSLQAGGWLDGDGTANGPVRRLETAWANACEAFRDGPAAARTKAPAAPSGVFVSEERPGT
jgi:hypothetical protein